MTDQPGTDVECDLDLYDSDVLAIEQVLDALNESRTRATTVDGWRREIEERFHEAGFKVAVVLRQVESMERPDGSVVHTSGDYIHTSITITKTMRDAEEAGRFINKLEDAKTEKLLMEINRKDEL